MKKNDIYEEIGSISPDRIAEADPTAPIVNKSQKGRARRIFAAIAACVAVFLISLLASVPYMVDEAAFRASLPDELKENADSDYIRLIYAIHNNNTLAVSDYSSSGGTIVESVGSGKDKSNYVEVTDNQVEGVIEGDCFKRSDTHIFYMDSKNNTVYSYRIDGENTSLVSQYKIDLGDIAERDDITPEEIYLSKDCNTLTVVIDYYNRYGCYGGEFLLSQNRSAFARRIRSRKHYRKRFDLYFGRIYYVKIDRRKNLYGNKFLVGSPTKGFFRRIAFRASDRQGTRL